MNLSPAIGIDLGTTFSCVGAFINGKVEIIPNELGARTTPSCVAFTELERVIGEIAMDNASTNPTNTIFDAKRMIGRSFDDKTVQSDMKRWPFEVVNIVGKLKVKVSSRNENKTFYPEEISSMVLKKMKKNAEEYLGKTVNEAVITVPAYFNNSQRQATCDAATIAGIKVLQIINEPTAAAIAYSLHKKRTGKFNVLIYDLGGGTFDVSIASIENKQITIKSTSGDTHLGGEDFTNRIVDHCVKIIKQKHNVDLTSNKKAMFRLREKCNGAKHKLSSVTEIYIKIDCLFDGIDFCTPLTRVLFNELNEDLFDLTIELVKKALSSVNIDRSEIDDIVLVGGSTRIIAIQELVQEFFCGQVLSKSINPDEAVAYGATVRAAALQNQKSDLTHNLVLQDVVSMSLGINTHGDIFSVIIPHNIRIPVKKVSDYTTIVNNQTSASIEILEGENIKASGNHELWHLLLNNIPPAPAGIEKVRVIFNIDFNGILTVTTYSVTVNNHISATIDYRKSRLTSSDVLEKQKLAELYDDEEKRRKLAVDAKNKLELYCSNMKKAVKNINTAQMKEDVDKQQILDKSNETINWLRSSELVENKIYEEKLNDLINNFGTNLEL